MVGAHATIAPPGPASSGRRGYAAETLPGDERLRRAARVEGRHREGELQDEPSIAPDGHRAAGDRLLRSELAAERALEDRSRPLGHALRSFRIDRPPRGV